MRMNANVDFAHNPKPGPPAVDHGPKGTKKDIRDKSRHSLACLRAGKTVAQASSSAHIELLVFLHKLRCKVPMNAKGTPGTIMT